MFKNFDEKALKSAREISIQQILNLSNFGYRTKIRCPFDDHNEKTASFTIYPDNSWHCYGCGKNGQNAIDFLIAMGATFNEAVEYLLQHK